MVKAGDIVSVRVVEVDVARSRIGLSMRKDTASAEAAPAAPTAKAPKKTASAAPRQGNRSAPATPTATLGDLLRKAGLER